MRQILKSVIELLNSYSNDGIFKIDYTTHFICFFCNAINSVTFISVLYTLIYLYANFQPEH